VEASVEQIRAGSEILAQMLRTDGLMIVGARYCLDTGVVDFFDDD
jgi:carbonic anhydrase